MSQTIKLKKGFKINLVGEAQKKTLNEVKPDTYAIKPDDFIGLSRPKLMVKEGENIKAGTPLFHERGDDKIMYTSPVSGEVVEIIRGAKRKVLAVKILPDTEMEFENFNAYSVSDVNSLNKEEAQEQLLKSGAWTQLIQRPFGIVANPEDAPKSIFISAFDSNPLAPSYAYMLKDEEQSFLAGIEILKKFSSKVHLNLDADAEISQLFSSVSGVQTNKIKGVHPAGNVGVQIHHIDPINKGDIVWTISPVGVAQIGKLFLEGKYDTSRLIALTGSEMSETGYVKAFPGASISKLVEGKLKNTDNVRVISGNPLTGEGVGLNGYLGYYSNQVTAIPEGRYEEFLGWIKPTTTKLSYHKAWGMLSSLLGGNKDFTVDTNTHGEERNFVVTGSYDNVLPMDILPVYLFKAIMAEDYDGMEALGIYELIEEDVALCEFVDVSKQPLQQVLREGINLIKEG